jgi:mono/diheme cytochrome c family protein
MLLLWAGAGLAAAPLVSGCREEGESGRSGSPPERPAPGGLAGLSPGRNWFEAYCTECHGQQGQGDGPGASLAKTPPADLTRIAARRGRFDASEVAAFIDGRSAVEAHGPREMPVWGRKDPERREPAMEEEKYLTPQMIAELVAYLETLQIP